MKTVKIAMQQVYSRRNSGDGLLVDLTLEILNEAFSEGFQVTVYANDPASFSDLENVVQVPCVSDNKFDRTWFSVKNLFDIIIYHTFGKTFKYDFLDKPLQSVDVIIGVGGGYMRGKGLVETLKCMINNVTQLMAAVNSKKPVIYFPQSVGPLNCSFHRTLVVSQLSKLSMVCMRDDRSVSDFTIPTALRVPDLAVMKLAKDLENSPREGLLGKKKKVLFVFRDLNAKSEKVSEYIFNIKKLVSHYPNSEVVIQSQGRGNDDTKFCREVFGGSEFRTLKDAVGDGGSYVVVSVRLHGAMESLIAGMPAVHLSYERKGFGAYSDLGIPEYVMNVFEIQFFRLIDLIDKLVGDDSEYWNSIAKKVPVILEQRARLISDVRGVISSE